MIAWTAHNQEEFGVGVTDAILSRLIEVDQRRMVYAAQHLGYQLIEIVLIRGPKVTEAVVVHGHPAAQPQVGEVRSAPAGDLTLSMLGEGGSRMYYSIGPFP